MYKILCFIVGFIGVINIANSQILRFGSKLDGTGNLVMVDTVFNLNSIPQVVYVKLFSKTPIPEDTLFIIAKNLHTSSKFILKRSTNKMDALATLRLKEDGIYKVVVINPKTKQMVASKKLYITSAVNPTVQALKADYQKQLAQNQTKTHPNPPKTHTNNTHNNVKTNPSSSNTHKPSTPPQNTHSTSTKDDLDDLDDDMDSDMEVDEGNVDADLDMKDDDLSDFDDAD